MSRILIFLAIAAAAAAAALVILTGGPSGPTTTQPQPSMDESAEGERALHVAQSPGNIVYWVMPGPRRIDADVFGTPDNPQMTGMEAMQQAPPPIQNLIQDLPTVVGLPEQARGTTSDGSSYTRTTMPTPFGDGGQIVSGQMDIVYRDRQTGDSDGPPGDTTDTVESDVSFTDPAGNDYRIEFDHIVQPPFPGYETDGGVLLDGVLHGATGTGSPLMPEVYTHGAFWSIAHVNINGERVDENKVFHCMTTETVRDSDYRLVFDRELPLSPSETIAGQSHHTHCIVLPITATPDGPVFEPVETAFELPNGQNQPFIHVMYEQDEIVGTRGDVTVPRSFQQLRQQKGASSQMTDSTSESSGNGDGASVDRTIAVEASEFAFDPSTLNVAPGETVRVELANDGQIAHNFTVETLDASTATIQPGETSTLTFTAPEETGTYPIRFICSVAGHEDAGMIGEIVVSE